MLKNNTLPKIHNDLYQPSRIKNAALGEGFLKTILMYFMQTERNAISDTSKFILSFIQSVLVYEYKRQLRNAQLPFLCFIVIAYVCMHNTKVLTKLKLQNICRTINNMDNIPL